MEKGINWLLGLAYLGALGLLPRQKEKILLLSLH